MPKHVFISKKISVDIKLIAEKGTEDKEAIYYTEMDGRMVSNTLRFSKESAEKEFNKLVEKYGDVTGPETEGMFGKLDMDFFKNLNPNQ